MRLFVVFLVIAVLAAALLTGLGYVARNLDRQMTDLKSREADTGAVSSPDAASADGDQNQPAGGAAADEAETEEGPADEIISYNAAALVKCVIDGESEVSPPAGSDTPRVRVDFRLINQSPYNLRGVVLTAALTSVTGGSREEHLQDRRWIDAETTLSEQCELEYSSAERGIPLCRMRVKTAYLRPADAERLAEEHPEDWRAELAQWE
jgi:hypothetical protein